MSDNKRIKLIAVARTPREHEAGFQFVPSVAPDTGMLFKFDSPKVLSFWMSNTYIPLDIAFINGGRIVKIERMIPLSLRTVSSGRPCDMALEVSAGTLSEGGVVPGFKVLVSDDESEAVIGPD